MARKISIRPRISSINRSRPHAGYRTSGIRKCCTLWDRPKSFAATAESASIPRPIKDHYTDVEVNTHYNGIVKFADGRCASVNFSWDTWGAENGPCVQVYGTKVLFSSPILIIMERVAVHVLLEEDMRDENGKISRDKTSRSGEYKKDIPLVFDCPTENRGLGLCEMIEAIRKDVLPGRTGSSPVM